MSGAPVHGAAGAPLLVMRGVDKAFAGVQALHQASLEVAAGQVMALVGQNGAGKSTLIKILNGAVGRDAGEVSFGGRPIDFASPQAAQAGGVSTIFQEVNLVPYRSVAENVMLGAEPKRFGLIDWRRLNREAAGHLAGLGIDVDVRRPLAGFGIAVQQMVAIARAVSRAARLVVMDEPTSSLDEREVNVLFDVIRRLRDAGTGVVFVSHRLDELWAVCDRVTILRDGRTVATAAMAEMSKLELVAAMLGRDLGALRRQGQTAFGAGGRATGAPLLEVAGLTAGRRVQGVDLDVRAGEIMGLAGLLGSGRTETARAIFGADPTLAGSVRWRGQEVRFAQPVDAIAKRIGLCSEDRKAEGIIPELSVRENLTLALLPRLATLGIVDETAQRAIVDRFIQRLGVRCAGPEQRIRELSGGNQQKVLLARWLATEPELLILDEPTRGIDVGAKAEIQALIDELARDGLGVLMISSELEELVEGCDRVVVLRDGRSVQVLAGAELTEPAIMGAMAHGAAPLVSAHG